MEGTQIDPILLLWDVSGHRWWIAWTWWRIHFGSTFSGAGNSSSGYFTFLIPFLIFHQSIRVGFVSYSYLFENV